VEPPAPKGQNPWRQLGFVLSIAFVFPAAIVVGYTVGWWIDNKLGTSPWVSLVGLALGLWAAFRDLLRQLNRLNRHE